MHGIFRASPTFRYSFKICGWNQVLEKIFGRRDVLRPLRDQSTCGRRLARYRVAVIAERQASCDDVMIIGLLVRDNRDLGRNRAVEIHDDLLGMEGVVVSSATLQLIAPAGTNPSL